MQEPTEKEIKKALTGVPREHRVIAEAALGIVLELAPLLQKMEKSNERK